MSRTKESKQDKKDIELARKRFRLAVDAESEGRAIALEDQKFRVGDQWPEAIKRSREEDKRPCLTINRIPQFLRQITNDQRQNRPSIKVAPVDDRADKDTAEVFQGIIRHIEYNSNADVAYDTAFDQAAATGLGYFRVITDYTSPKSFEQEILIKRIRNRFSVYVDPHYQEPDGSDMQWAFIFETLSKEEFKSQYPDAELSQMEDWMSIGDHAADWVNEDSCRIAEYYYKDYKAIDLVLLSTGEVYEKSEIDDELLIESGIEVVSERKSRVPVVKWCKLNGHEILEETEWPGLWIPIIPVLGDEIDVDGKRHLEGIIRHAKDPQRMYNFWASSETESIALAPRAPFIGAAGAFEGFEGDWAEANHRNIAYLEYNPTTEGGQPLPPPSRNAYEPPVQAITNARLQSNEDLKATTGIYDASLGNRSNENSGIAIQRRNAQSQTANFHFVDNLARSLRHLGRVLVDLIPKIYDVPQSIRIIGEDGEEQVVRINEVFEKNGKPKMYELGAGKYDVTVSSGPSYQTKRQEAVDSMLSLTQSFPQMAQFAGDLMVKNMDWPGADEIAKRLQKMLPPELQDTPDGQEPIPPQVQAQMMQMSQMVEQLTAQLNDTQAKLDSKQIEMENDERDRLSKERIEYAKLEVALKKALAEIDSREGMMAFKEELNEINRRASQYQATPMPNLAGPSMQEPMAGPSFGDQQQQAPIGGFSPSQPIEE